MRIVTRQAVKALLAGKTFSSKNTRVSGKDEGEYSRTLFLHGNPIAQLNDDGLYISTAGWNTLTTRERLNGLPGVRLFQHRGKLYLNNIPWDGEWVRVDMPRESGF